ncbi:MAG: anhydro-N-acetylmuramic acid kinase [Phycisphaerae bacterium]|nr:anhydro-N-acetylmuramic acid kinase [Phycisphaerae bacterium]
MPITATKLSKLANQHRLRVIGLMSGTSADGVDAAAVDLDRDGLNVLAFATFPYSQALRTAVFRLFNPETSQVDDICRLNVLLGEVFADAVLKLCDKGGIARESVDLIGSHGQTIYHDPVGRRSGRKVIRSTLQIGEPSVVAERTGITTVADFRPRDMAAGGQGAPLVPYADYILFAGTDKCRAIQNIGGIANVTWLPPKCNPGDIVAFDTGPGNMVIDRMAEIVTGGRMKYDRNGRIATSGIANASLLKQLLNHPFYRRRPPKTTGREVFGTAYSDAVCRQARAAGISDPDLMATVTALTARTIAQAYRRLLPAMPEEMILCGGGGNNPTLVSMLQQEMREVRILRTDDFGIHADAKEAVSFAILAYATVKGIANNVPGATGAGKPVILGKIVPA